MSNAAASAPIAGSPRSRSPRWTAHSTPACTCCSTTWPEAPREAIDAYHQALFGDPGATDVLAERHQPEPTTIDELRGCAPGTLGLGYLHFVIDDGLEANLARNRQQCNEQPHLSGKLDRLRDDIGDMIVRGFQLHDMMHTITGFSSKPLGELTQAGFHFGQLQCPYHAMRFAVTTAHLAFVDPGAFSGSMYATCTGWMMGRAADNIPVDRLEDELDTPLDDVRARIGLDASAFRTF